MEENNEKPVKNHKFNVNTMNNRREDLELTKQQIRKSQNSRQGERQSSKSKPESRAIEKEYDRNEVEVIIRSDSRDRDSAPSENIFNRLYADAHRKQESKLLNYEIKKLSELEKCTFKPKI